MDFAEILRSLVSRERLGPYHFIHVDAPVLEAGWQHRSISVSTVKAVYDQKHQVIQLIYGDKTCQISNELIYVITHDAVVGVLTRLIEERPDV